MQETPRSPEGAEGSIEQPEDWKTAQSELYFQLGDQLRSLWSGNSYGAGTPVNGQNGAEAAIAGPAEPEPTQRSRAHWCQAHNTEFKRRSKSGVVWFSHRQGEGWCNEEG